MIFSFIYFPEDKLTIHGSSGSLISSITPVLLGASRLLILSIREFLVLNSSLNRLVAAFCFPMTSENKSAYLISSYVTCLLLNSLSRTLHFSRCCWSSVSVLHNKHKRLVCINFCLKFALHSVPLDLNAKSRLTSSLLKIGLRI